MTTTPVTSLGTAGSPRVERKEHARGITPITLTAIAVTVITLVLGIAFGSAASLGLAGVSLALSFALYDADKTHDKNVARGRM